MNQQVSEKMGVLKKVFLVLLALDVIGMIFAGAALFSTFKGMAEYGQIMLIVAVVIVAIAVAVMLFDVLAKVFLIRSTAPAFTWSAQRKGYATAAKFLLVFNIGAVIIGLLSAGGEGATVLNQANLYLRLLAALAEVITVIVYLRKVKGLLAEEKADNR